MRELTFKQILDECIRATGFRVDSPEAQDKLPIFVELINDWTARCMEFEFWPDTMRMGEFTMTTGADYTYLDKGNPWDENPIGKVDLRACMFQVLPELSELNNAYRRVGEFDGKLLCSASDAPDGDVWVYYQLLPPVFTDTVYSATATYSQGDLVYDSTTQFCYISRTDANTGNAVTDTTNWKKQAFPAFLRYAVKWGVASEFLSEEDGKYQTEAKASKELERLQISVLQGSGNGYKAKRRQ